MAKAKPIFAFAKHYNGNFYPAVKADWCETGFPTAKAATDWLKNFLRDAPVVWVRTQEGNTDYEVLLAKKPKKGRTKHGKK